MVQLCSQWLDQGHDLPVIDQMIITLGNVALHDHVDPEGMTMHSSAFMPIRKARQVVSRLEGERFGEFDMHEGGMISLIPLGSHMGLEVTKFSPAHRIIAINRTARPFIG